MTASFSRFFVGAPLLLLLLLMSTLDIRPASCFVPNPTLRLQSLLWAESSDDNEKPAQQDMADNGTNKKKYDVGSGRNKPLDHLRKTDSNTTSLTDVEFWGAGYIQEGGQLGAQKPRIPSAPLVYDKKSRDDGDANDRVTPKKKGTTRYDLGMNKNSPIISGEERRRTRKLIANDDEGEFLAKAVGSGGTMSLSGLSRVEEEKEENDDSNTSEKSKANKRPPHHLEGWEDIKNDTKSSGLVGAHIDGGSTSPSKVIPATLKASDATKFKEPHVDDEAVQVAAAAYAKALINGDASVDESRDEIMTMGMQSVDSRSDEPVRFEDIDLSVPLSVYDPDNNIDLVWDLMRYEANEEAIREPILVSFLYSTILNHPTLESALAFHLANKLSAPAMIATQINDLMREALDASMTFRRSLRADILAVRDRDPACEAIPIVFLYFKGFHSLQSYRVANHLWETGRTTLAHYLQSQVSQTFQIDIHPNATILDGVMLDHGTGKFWTGRSTC